jgi:hypothetical protein
MNWVALNIYSPFYDEVRYIFKIRDLFDSGELINKKYYFERGYSDAFYIRLNVLCETHESDYVIKTIINFRKNTPIFKPFKIVKKNFINEYIRFGGVNTLRCIEKLFAASSIITIDLIFESQLDNFQLPSYFNLLLRGMILNYITVNSLLEGMSVFHFFQVYTDFLDRLIESSARNHRFDMAAIIPAMRAMDIKNVLNLLNQNDLDIGANLDSYLETCGEVRNTLKLLVAEEGILLNKNLYFDIDLPDPLFGILIELCQLNNNRMGIFPAENIYLANLLKDALY